MITVKRQRAGAKVNPMTGTVKNSDWNNPSTIEVSRVALAPATEKTARSAGLEYNGSGFILYKKGEAADIILEDRIVFGNTTYVVVSKATWVSPFTGILAGEVFSLDRIGSIGNEEGS